MSTWKDDAEFVRVMMPRLGLTGCADAMGLKPSELREFAIWHHITIVPEADASLFDASFTEGVKTDCMDWGVDGPDGYKFTNELH